MSSERFMRHHYGASGYVRPGALTPQGEKIALVQMMSTEGYCGIDSVAKEAIREILHSFYDASAESAALREELKVRSEHLYRVSDELAVWQLENMALREELQRQWEAAHSNLCEYEQCPNPIDACDWPKPKILEGE